jgi:hypothetical protein
VNLVASFCVHIGQEPVAQDVGLDPPGEGKFALLVDKVDEACFRVANTTSRLLDGECIGILLGFSGSRLGGYGKRKNLDGCFEGIQRLGSIALAQAWRRRDLALVERVSI